MSARPWKPLLIASLLIPLAACQTVGTQDDEGIAVEDRAAGSSVSTSGLDDAGGRVRGIGGIGGAGGASGLAGSWRGKSVDDPTSPLSKRVIYFDYDSDEVRDEYRATLEAHAAYLSEKRAAATLEGNTDERGSREYNIGLGERRAQTVRRALLAQGVAESQIATVSYGEERPAVEGSDEAAFAQNRRVELVHAQ